ncbi:MAG: tail fiber domain-containing protein [Marinilabiliaceae bacterium]|nr:tail fiber domain-containing protein [Marinilabiliaceae bacterium]
MPAKYRIQFKSTKYAIPYRLDIHDASYSGAVIELAAANPPVVLRKDSDGIFSGTSLDIGIEVPASLPWGITDLYSSTARDHKVELYKSDVLVWAGYLVPEEYADPLTPPPFDIFLRAVDGIGTLKDFDFDIAPTAAHMTHLAVLQHCLAKLALELPTAILIRIWEDAHNTTHSPLSQTLISPAAFYDDGKPLTCDKVISRILNSYDPDITLTQHAGHWLITRDIDATANTYVVHDAAGQLTATAAQLTATTALESVAAYAPGKCFPIGALSRSFLAQNKKLTAEVDYILAGSILKYANSDSDYQYLAQYYDPVSFAYRDVNAWCSKNFYWFAGFGLYTLPGLRIVTSKGTHATLLGGVQGTGGLGLISTDRMGNIPRNITAAGLSSKLTVNVAALHQSDTQNTDFKITLSVYVSQELTYYLGASGWQTSSTSVPFIIPTLPNNTSTASLTELSLYIPPMPDDGLLDIRFDAKIGGYPLWGLIIEDIALHYIREESQPPFESSLTADVLINSNAIKSASVECFGDAPSPESVAREIWHAVFLRPDMSPTRAWRMTGDTVSVGLLSILARSAASNNRTPRQQYSGTLMGAALSPNSIITHAGNGARAFRIISASHALHADELEVELRELLPYAEAQFQLPTSPVYGDAKNSLTTTDGANNYTVFGGNVGIGKRIHQLPLATTIEGKFIIVDSVGNESAEKYPYIEGVSKALFDSLFEVRGSAGSEYICAKYPFASVGDITAFAESGADPSTEQAYDSARLGGVLASTYTRRDVAETITGSWIFPSFTQVGGNIAASYLKFKTDSREWWVGVGMHNSWDDLFGIYDSTATKVRMSIDLDGRFGFGKAPGAASVEVKGNVGIGQFTSGTAVIDAYNGYAYYGCNTAENGLRIDANGDMYGTRDIKASRTIISGNGANGGITNAVYVAGANRIWSFGNAVDYGIYYNQGGVDYIYMPFGSHSNPKFKFDVNGNFLATGEITAHASSDRRLKTNITTITNAATILRRLVAVEYDWNDTAIALNPAKRDARHSVSFIAQDWEQVLPWATHTIYDTYKSIDKDVLPGYLVAGWNEHEDKLTRHERRIEQLESDVMILHRAIRDGNAITPTN